MKKTDWVLYLLIALFLIDLILYVVRPFGENSYIVSDFQVAFFSFLAFYFGLQAFRLHGWGSLQGKSILFLTLGLFFWFMGESIWAFYEIYLSVETPIGSVADLSWWIGYPLLLVGILFMYKITKCPVPAKRKILCFLLVLVVSSLLIYFTLPVLKDPQISVKEKLFTAGYVLGDMLLADACLIVVLTPLMGGGKLRTVWLLIILGIFATAAADVYYALFAETYETGSVVDLLWDLSYLTIAYGLSYQKRETENLIEAPKT